MNRRPVWLILVAVSAVLILSTTYLALYYAPIQQTGVKSAREILTEVESSTITVAGFVTDFTETAASGPDTPGRVDFLLADFSDYELYRQAQSGGLLGTTWWRTEPIPVVIELASPSVDVGGHILGLADGVNVSVKGCVEQGSASPFLDVKTPDDVVVGLGAGQFSLMTAPVAQKIFYFHMPSAWVSYVGFFVTLVSSIFYLRTRKPQYDRIAHASAELGVLFATIAILTGPVWAKQEWGVYWRWDDTKLVTTFVMWLVYIGYLALRAAVSDGGTRARVSAVYGIVGFVTMPMSLLSSRIAPLLRSGHPQVIASGSGGLSPEAGLTIGVAVVAFTLLFITMLIKRVEIAGSEEELEELKREVGGEE